MRKTSVVAASFVILVSGLLAIGAQSGRQAAADVPLTAPQGGALPASKPLLTGVKLVVGDAYSTCALLLAGGVDCWGGNGVGELGDGTNAPSAVPKVVTGITKAVALTGDNNGSAFCALLSTGGVVCWGSNHLGELGNGSIATTNWSDVPVVVKGITDAKAVVNNSYATFCAVHATGSVSCWGGGSYGALGNGSTLNADVPVHVTGLTAVKSVVGVFASFCAVLTSGKVSCWGNNQDGRLGNGTTIDSSVPVTVKNITNALSVMPDVSNSNFNGTYCALLATGHVDCWGFGFYGEIGNGTFYTTGTDSVDVPSPVTGISSATLLTSGGASFCARLTTGHVKCWGNNSEGQLGNGGFTNSAVPVSALSITNAVSFSSDFLSECATLATGIVKCWGYNSVGQVGNGTTTNASSPVTVKTISNAASVTGNTYLTNCAVLTTANLDCWGYGQDGELGNGIFYNTTTSYSDVPVAVLAAA